MLSEGLPFVFFREVILDNKDDVFFFFNMSRFISKDYKILYL